MQQWKKQPWAEPVAVASKLCQHVPRLELVGQEEPRRLRQRKILAAMAPEPVQKKREATIQLRSRTSGTLNFAKGKGS